MWGPLGVSKVLVKALFYSFKGSMAVFLLVAMDAVLLSLGQGPRGKFRRKNRKAFSFPDVSREIDPLSH